MFFGGSGGEVVEEESHFAPIILRQGQWEVWKGWVENSIKRGFMKVALLFK